MTDDDVAQLRNNQVSSKVIDAILQRKASLNPDANIQNEQNEQNPQKQDSGNIYMKAAIEALNQNAENDDTFSYLLITNSKKSYPVISRTKEKERITDVIATLLDEDPEFSRLIHASLMMYEFRKDPKKVLKSLMSIFDKEDPKKE